MYPLNKIFVHPDIRSAMTPEVLLKDLEKICKKVNINKTYIMRNKDSALMVKTLANKISKDR